MANDNATDLCRGIYRRQYSGFIRGRRINSISLEAEAWFWRIQAVVDDFGNADADPEMLWLVTVGKRKSGVTVEDVTRWRNEMVDAGLLRLYEIGSDTYLHIEGFSSIQPCGRNGKRFQRFPPFPGESRKTQMNPDESRCSDNENTNEDHNHKQLPQPKPRRDEELTPPPFQSEKFIEVFSEFETYRRQRRKPLTGIARAKLFAKIELYPEAAVINALNESMANTWIGVFPERIQRNGNGYHPSKSHKIPPTTPLTPNAVLRRGKNE